MATLEQYQRFVANEPESQIEYRTLELYHPQFSQVYRYVNDYSDLVATLETGAPRDAGQEVTFQAATFAAEEPSERNDNDQILTVTAGTVDGQLNEIVQQISGSGYFEQIETIYRVYYSGDLSMPAKSPLYLSGSSVTFSNKNSATFTAEDTDLAVKRTGILYTTELFAGLAQ